MNLRKWIKLGLAIVGSVVLVLIFQNFASVETSPEEQATIRLQRRYARQQAADQRDYNNFRQAQKSAPHSGRH